MIGLGFGILILFFAYLRIDWAYEDLSHYGDDRPSHASLGQGLALLGVAGCAVTIVAIAREMAWARTVALATTAAAIGAGAYLFWVGSSNSDKIGFDSGGLQFFGVVVIAYGVASGWRATRLEPGI